MSSISDSQSDISIRYPSELPIVERREEIVAAIREHQVVVITGETGSGKSTQIPKMCLEAGLGRRKWIGCTQPRRIAAITLANRVAEEMGELSHWVGHKIRFQDKTTRSTRIKFMTDGVLLAEAQSDRLFRGYDAIVVDEAHERTLNIDFLLGLIKKILPRRQDLKVVVTSATIDPEKFSQAFDNAPIIEVSGRTYPVEVWHRAPEVPEDGEEETNYVDNAIAAVDSLKRSSRRGDILVFMPTESDIRETVQRLEEKRYFHTIVLPLFGRMAASDQQRIFQLTAEEKIVVATNVAETSVTIPRIKYVIDTGLARISQYNARSRTQSLPVAPISQAAADQRKGRCGRVEAGICIRLYSEEDYLGRSAFTAPEMQRANLAEVILRMLHLKFGSVQDFPFLDPPSPAAVKDAYGVLRELNAIDASNRLTPDGRIMARLPLDPRLARILIAAGKERALREVMILAAALSIQDPRERPVEKEAQADQAHAKFRDPRSDFVGLLKIWEAYERQWQATPSQGQMRKFCRENFLSYRRLREWRDVFEEIGDILGEAKEFHATAEPASYEAIHRAIVSGYLSNIAMRKEKNIYLGTKGRQVMIFPGSGLFNKAGSWIVASEVVQTSRLFARTVGEIKPEWIEELGAHLCQRSYSEPHWEKKLGQVAAFEKVTLYGLVIVERRKINYGRIAPDKAREVFIQSALVEGELPGAHPFMEHNRELIRQIEELENKTRRRNLLVDDFTLHRFYDDRIPDIMPDVRSFDKLIKDRGGDQWLRMTEADLLRDDPDFRALDQFPDAIEAGDVRLPLRYAFEPGNPEDGVTVTVPVRVLSALSSEPFEWLVPGLLVEKTTALLKALPKGIRKRLVPVGDAAREVAERLPFREGNLYIQMSRCLQELKGLSVGAGEWDRSSVPEHLQMRFEVVDPEGKKLGEGRNLDDLKPITTERHEDRIWHEARRKWEKAGAASWGFGDIPPKIELGEDAFGVKLYAYPGVVAEGETVALRLFMNLPEAMEATRSGFMLLYRLVFAAEIKNLRRDWTFPDHMAPLVFFVGKKKDADLALQEYVMREIFELNDPVRAERALFEGVVKRLRGSIAALGRERVNEVFQVAREREEARTCLERFRKMGARNPKVLMRLDVLFKELEELVPSDFLKRLHPRHMEQLPRLLKALQVRAERVYNAPEKDIAKAEQLQPHIERREELEREASAAPTPSGLRFLDDFRWSLEEFKASVFAPEIKSRRKISSKRLDEKWREWVLTKGRETEESHC